MFHELWFFYSASIYCIIISLEASFCSLCAGAEQLLQVVYGAIPSSYLQTSIQKSQLAVQILNYLFNKLNELCLVQGGEVA